MKFATTIVVAGLTAALGAGAAFAQSGPEGSSYQQGLNQQDSYGQAPYQQGPGRPASHRQHPGFLMLVKEEMRAGRISQNEGSLLIKKIHEIWASRRAEREARYGDESTPPAMQGQMPQSH
jgi:hypothetical protein